MEVAGGDALNDSFCAEVGVLGCGGGAGWLLVMCVAICADSVGFLGLSLIFLVVEYFHGSAAAVGT